jgi:ABC-2 type transport system permease protein
MRNTLTITKRELGAYFGSPIAYAVVFGVLIIMGLFFVAYLRDWSQFQSSPDPVQLLSIFVTLVLFTTPALTMGTLAEEQRSGTVELLLTAPLREWELVLGKWLAAFIFTLLLVALTALYPLILSRFVQPGLDLGALAAAYVGLVLLTAATLSVGVFVSALFANQIAAFFGILAVLLVLWIIGYPFQYATGPLAAVARHMDFSNRFYNNFMGGAIDLVDVVYFVTVAVFFLFIAARTVESRRWR